MSSRRRRLLGRGGGGGSARKGPFFLDFHILPAVLLAGWGAVLVIVSSVFANYTPDFDRLGIIGNM